MSTFSDEKVYCRFCGKEIIFDGRKPLPITFSCGDNVVQYCGEHAKLGQEIFNKFNEKKRYNNDYCEMVLLEKIEKQLTSDVGDWHVKFPNLYHNGDEIMNTPILRYGKPIGFVSNVYRDYIIGKIWSRYIPIVSELDVENKRTMSFELIC